MSLKEEEVNDVMAKYNKSGTDEILFDDFIPFMLENLVERGHGEDDVAAAFKELAIPCPGHDGP